MSTQGIRDFRPKLHFTPKKMWMNDPNGLVYENGKYHLFYQYHPESTLCGPMHWGHAISTDLIKWQHLPIALYPDNFGYIFSGSAVYDVDNTSGFGSAGNAPIVAIFTHHGVQEQQSIAYSIDGINFEKYEANPVIPNPGINDFRDPKVFWNPIKKCWSLVLAAGDRVHFYSSVDLKSWKKTGEFGADGNFAPGVWECPDLFPLKTECGQKWVLLVSMGMPTEAGGARTQYFIGDFDGDNFRCDDPFNKAEFIDEGFDNYAGVTYNNTIERILIGWGLNWQYAEGTPTGEYCGMMTLPRKLSLVNTPKGGLRLASQPIGMNHLIGNGDVIVNGDCLTSEVFALRIEGSGPCLISLINRKNQCLRFGIDDSNSVFIDRTKAGAVDFSEKFASDLYSKHFVQRYYDDNYIMDAIFDVSALDLFIDNGTLNFSLAVYPDIPYEHIKISGNVKVSLSDINI